ncbi:MAG TPA: hypothetical protein VFZ76_12935 [Anaerolineales bacterium]
MAAITPPPIRVKIMEAPDNPSDGDKMAFSLMFGPIAVPWVARFEDISTAGFTDRQIKGPFREWVHQHKFVAIGDGLTEVVDQVEVKLKRHLIWGSLGFLMWSGMPFLFAYRGWKTRQLLECEE